ncbi:MAG: SagB/ThcOx family dehydrogenase [Nibricoccus sp.]
MKNFLALAFVLVASLTLAAENIQLPAPQKTGGMPLMEALAKRATSRAFDSRELSPQQLSNLLWAGFGINRDNGKRTAPSAHNKQELDLYVLMKTGAYIYDAEKNLLTQIAAEDLRQLGAKTEAPVCLLFVADLAKRNEKGDSAKAMATVDSGFISQNVYLFCASEGLATGYRIGGFDRPALGAPLKLRPNLEIVAAQPVGYAKP